MGELLDDERPYCNFLFDEIEHPGDDNSKVLSNTFVLNGGSGPVSLTVVPSLQILPNFACNGDF